MAERAAPRAFPKHECAPSATASGGSRSRNVPWRKCNEISLAIVMARLSVACELFCQSDMNAARGPRLFVSWFYSAARCWPPPDLRPQPPIVPMNKTTAFYPKPLLLALFTPLLAITALFAVPNAVQAGLILYVSTGNEIDKVSSTGTVSTFATPPGSITTGLAFDSSGNLYVAENGSDQISKVTPGGVASLFATLPGGSNPQGLAFDSSGNLYAADVTSNQISKITPGGTVSLFATLPGGSNPFGLAFDTSGNLYAANATTDTISKITSGGVVSLFATLPGGSDPFGLAFDSSGNLYAADHNTNKISKITPGGVVSLFASLPAGSGVDGLAFDPLGNLYVADTNANKISEISPDGLTVTTFATGIPSPKFILAVPEPGSAGVVVAFALGAVALLRRVPRRRMR